MIKVIIYGAGKLSQMIYYLLKDSAEYEVICFSADQKYCLHDTIFSLPLIPFEDIEKYYPPEEYQMLTVMGGFEGVRFREKMFNKAKAKGYQHINYVHPTAITEGLITYGENNIIFPYSILGFSGKMGNNNVIREKVYIGHDFNMGDHNYIGIGSDIGGESSIGNLVYIAMGTTITNGINLADESFIGIGSLVLKNSEPYCKYYGRPAHKVSEHKEEGVAINVGR